MWNENIFSPRNCSSVWYLEKQVPDASAQPVKLLAIKKINVFFNRTRTELDRYNEKITEAKFLQNSSNFNTAYRVSKFSMWSAKTLILKTKPE